MAEGRLQSVDGREATAAAPALLREGLLTAVVGTVFYVLLSIGLAVATGFAVRFETLPSALLAVLSSWALLLWLVAVVAVTALGRGQTVRTRTVWILWAAVLASVIDTTIRFAPAIAYSGPAIVILMAIPLLSTLGAIVIAAGAGRLIAVNLLARGLEGEPGRTTPTRRPSREQILQIASIVMLASAWIAVLALVRQWFAAYFRLFGAEVVITEAAGAAYLVTAAVAILAAVSALSLAIIRKISLRPGIVTMVAVLLVAFIFQVPAGRFIPEPSAPAPTREYVPCFGEGDPNCIGG